MRTKLIIATTAGVLSLGGLAVAGVLLPLVAAATPLSRPRSVAPAVLLFLAMTAHATFLDEQLSGFPVGWLCTMGVVVALAGTVVLLFNALGLRRERSGTRSRLS